MGKKKSEIKYDNLCNGCKNAVLKSVDIFS